MQADVINGYFCDFQVYVKKPSQGTVLEVGISERIILQLTKCLHGKHFYIYADNFFTTTYLLETLHPVASVWMNKKPVTMLSTYVQADVTHIAHRRVRDGLRISVQCPDTVVLYNQTMAGVDKGDHYQKDYCVETKSCKVYKYIFCFLLDVSITNSYNILSSFVPTTMSPSYQHLKILCLWVAEHLVANYNSCPSSRPVTHSAPVLPPQQVTMTQCTCTAYICKDCLGKPPLCLTGSDNGSDCFRHHTLL